MALGRFKKLTLGTGISGTDLGGGELQLDAAGTGIAASIIDAKGDLLVGSANDAIDNLAVGSNGKVLTADSAQTLGMKWDTPATGSVAADALWDAKGDLAVASGSDAADNLAVGSNGQVLTADSGQTLGVKWAAVAAGSPTEHSYVEQTSSLSVTATTAATAQTFISSAAVAYDGSTRVRIEVFLPAFVPGTSGSLHLMLWDGSTDLGILGRSLVPSGAGSDRHPGGTFVRYLTPSAATHTYHAKAYRTTANGTLLCGAGGTDTDLPAYIRISTA